MFGSTPLSADNINCPTMSSIRQDILSSTELIFRSRLTWLLVFGPIALIGKAGLFGESACFILAGLTLIPLAERLSFVTEEVANHTSQTIGALLNATFGNAPELLISAAALQEGFYRVVQLTLLGSILTNLLFVFGMSCLLGGLRYQVQELRIVSGNASIGMLMMAVAGLALPAALTLSAELRSLGTNEKQYVDKNGDGVSDFNDGPTLAMVGLSRFNAVIMIVGYLLYLLFQLGSHKDEFDDLHEEDENSMVEGGGGNHVQRHQIIKTKKKARKNRFCRRLFKSCRGGGCRLDDDDGVGYLSLAARTSAREMEMSPRAQNNNILSMSQTLPVYIGRQPGVVGEQGVIPQCRETSDVEESRNGGEIMTGESNVTEHMSNVSGRRRSGQLTKRGEDVTQLLKTTGLSLQEQTSTRRSNKSHCSDGDEEVDESYLMSMHMATIGENGDETHMSFRAGLLWLFLITLSISAMSDILVDTIDGFALRMHISEVFTSLVILPFFSNIAEQVSALIFAYRNEMDLCIGITVGSAVQIALFVLPGSVLIGWAMDRSMSLFFRGFETCCLIFSVVSVAAVLQGGTTNWLVGAYLLGVYFMVAAGFWYHELENLSIDGELHNLHNHTPSDV
ncbi:hypothetical protein ACHAW5_000555 [Stephanodiscus triporus]|uniref:Sodium/calcium exchanger membrane region domain-containing protein n=1 Tax=Stephanodiscus triporus TaxID=2934178 RepID=A0ABD3NNM9_9STRA